MATTATYKCKCCKTEFIARVADRARGWARFCSKSCKATKQERRNGQHAAYRRGEGISHLGTGPMGPDGKYSTLHWRDEEDPSWDAHKF